MLDEIIGLIVWGGLLAIPVLGYWEASREADRLHRQNRETYRDSLTTA